MNIHYLQNKVTVPQNNNLVMGSFQYNNKNILNRNINVNNANLIPSNRPSISTVITNSNDYSAPKSKWGAPTWFLFHTLAHKLKDECDDKIVHELFQVIVLLCSNLPCPTCTKHATEYMNKINARSINTREDLKNLLFQFHNDVNKRKGYPLFERSKLDEKYELANTKNIIHYFLYFFKQKDFNISMITDNMHREHATANFQSWFMKNIDSFVL
jgi:hypothetical protein